MLTYLIQLSVIDSIDKSGVSKKVRVSWPRCFVIAIGEVDRDADEDRVQLISSDYRRNHWDLL